MSREHKPPVMIGVFSKLADDFINYKRSLGFKYEHEPKCLSRFCKFSEEFGIKEVKISEELALAWIAPKKNEAAKSRSHRITCIRQFAIYLQNLGHETYIVPEQKGLYKSSFVPYIFTKDEIGAIIKAADKTKKLYAVKNMHLSLPVIFRLLYGCGLRISEVVNLRYKDVNLSEGILTLHKSKNGKERLIPMSDSVKAACIKYAEKIWWDKDEDFFFQAPDKTMISPMTVYQRFRTYLHIAGIPHGGKGAGPRLHDIRHTFAVHTLQKWIREGLDLNAMLPILSTYMGHKNIHSTSIYLRLTAEVFPELLKDVENTCSYVIPEVSK